MWDLYAATCSTVRIQRGAEPMWILRHATKNENLTRQNSSQSTGIRMYKHHTASKDNLQAITMYGMPV